MESPAYSDNESIRDSNFLLDEDKIILSQTTELYLDMIREVHKGSHIDCNTDCAASNGGNTNHDEESEIRKKGNKWKVLTNALGKKQGSAKLDPSFAQKETSTDDVHPKTSGSSFEMDLSALHEFIATILHADDAKLKMLCKEKKIRINGKAAMKHKYAYALLENYFSQNK
jgi:hypothetical protein